MLLVGIVVICCCAGATEAAYMKYKDPKQPINVRIKDLMIRMTLEEKIGQMVQIDRTVASYEVMKNYSIGILVSLARFDFYGTCVFLYGASFLLFIVCREYTEWWRKCSS